MYTPDSALQGTPAAGDTSVSDAVSAPSFQDVLGGSANPPPPDVTTTPELPTMPAPMASAGPDNGKPVLWRQMLAGALQGLAGSAGQKSFGGGLAAGTGAALDSQRQARLDALAKTKQESEIRFQNAQSAQLVRKHT